MGSIVLKNVGKIYAGDTVAARDINLEIEDGEFVVFVGPSGCGKSTLLRMIAGLETVTSGQIMINGSEVNDVAARDRDIAMVFQNYALYPQMTVRQNIAFALELRRLPKAEIEARVSDAAHILDLKELLDRKPRQLSGGQRQRVAMGRAIVRNPEAFLLDEPLSNLDAKLRVLLRAELGRLHARLGVTTIHVTHDQVEAMTLGSRVAVFSRGRLQQYDTPHKLYDSPVNIFVASFIGSPGMNLFDATVVETGALPRIKIGNYEVEITRRNSADNLINGQKLIAGIRPEHLDWVPVATEKPKGIDVTIELIERLEPESYVMAKLSDQSANLRASEEFQTKEEADHSDPRLLQEKLVTFRVSAENLPKATDRVQLVINPDKVYLFDVSNGLAI